MLAPAIFALSCIKIHSVEKSHLQHHTQGLYKDWIIAKGDKDYRSKIDFFLLAIPDHQAKMAPSELNFITGNANKLAEVKAILGDTVVLKNQSLDLIEIQGTVEEVSIDKCKRAAEIVSIKFGCIHSVYSN
jgi:hypothetical protein